MAESVLILNPGSASRKLALFVGAREVASAHLELEAGAVTANLTLRGEESKQQLPETVLPIATDWFVQELVREGVIPNAKAISAAGLRIVASGEPFRTNRVIDEHYERQLRTAYQRSPLHLGPALAELDHLREALPDATIVGVSDSAFHRTLPEVARRYAIPAGDAERRGLFRYGFHGISLRAVVCSLRQELGHMPERTIVAHLGSGVSLTALKHGKSVDTSMGATPMEGLIMSTRSGDVDPGILLEMASERSARQVETDLNRHAGLLALGGDGDIRELLSRERGGDKRAKLALDAFAYRVRKYVGAYVAVLGGLDCLVFTATVGQRSAPIRSRVCAGLEPFDVRIDSKRNRRVAGFTEISPGRAKVKVFVVPNDENAEMARCVRASVRAR